MRGRKAALAALGAAAFAGIFAMTHAVWGQMERHRALEAVLAASLPKTVFLEELTWAEMAHLQKAGFDRVIIPTGGTEQNGFHMVLGKHNFIVRHTAQALAREVGKTLVAPVMAYVPEGAIEPPQGHMKFTGTLSLPEPVFMAVLEHAARSLKAHGFRYIFFLGDSGGNQAAQAQVAAKLTALWQDEGIKVYSLGAYYKDNGQKDHPQVRAEAAAFPHGTHAGIRDTSELLFVQPKGVRRPVLEKLSGLPRGFAASGSVGHPEWATEALGKALIALKIRAGAQQMRALLAGRREEERGALGTH